ncbi:DUF222 domain-containing protein, partial [Microbacterium sp. ZW T5_56]|uniref:DUF222 domain-containing protein n=1 Tax=Microbacterium sp. ZW T5_56 TaxID=3378081 RepID=UPI003854F08A
MTGEHISTTAVAEVRAVTGAGAREGELNESVRRRSRSGTRVAIQPDIDVGVVRTYVDAIAAVTRSRAATDALEVALFADLVALSGASGASSESDLELRSLAAEVGVAIRVSDRTVQRWMSDAYQLVHDFPAVHAALSSGEISRGHVRVILEHGLPIEAGPARDEYVERALPLARAQSQNRLKGMLARVAEEVRDVGITERHREARRARAVWVTDDLDGMSTLHAFLPSVLAHGVKDRLDQMAHALRAANKDTARTGPGASTGEGTHTGTATNSQSVTSAGTGIATDSQSVTDAEAGSASDDQSATGTGAGAGAGTNANAGAATNAGADAGAGAGACRDSRTVDQIRADILADLLLTNTPSSVDTAIGSIRATVAVTVPV